MLSAFLYVKSDISSSASFGMLLAICIGCYNKVIKVNKVIMHWSCLINSALKNSKKLVIGQTFVF